MKIVDPDAACVSSAKSQLIALKLLLENDAVKAKEIVADYEPAMKSKEEYFAAVDSLDMDKHTVTYQEDGTVILNFTK